QASSCHLGCLPPVPDAWEPTVWAVQGEWKGSFLQLGGGSSSCNYIFLLLLFQGGPVEILPFLYLGSAYHASKCEFLANLHITALLNVSRKSSESFKDQYCYKWIPVEDSHTADISSHFQEAIDFIGRSGGKILVHCEAGISRSPTICMAYLMKTKRLRLDEAFDYIKQRRSLISPNFGFMGQLLQYESEILSSTPSPPVASCKREAAGGGSEYLFKSFSGFPPPFFCVMFQVAKGWSGERGSAFPRTLAQPGENPLSCSGL
uniref:protein-tyrosine-phosphatase n=1 Tax=Zosterops lateralis melanops TaxID=1220523 RepID=A0A8D2QMG3_ZOSLA